jgi:hypothetical protein
MWVAPAAMFIEGAADSLKSADPRMLSAQTKELQSFGPGRAQALGATDVSNDFQLGYQLGLQTARQILLGSPQLAMKGINPDSLL